MKRWIYLLTGFILFFNCSVDNAPSEPSFYFEALPMNSVEVPNEFSVGQTYTIKVKYSVPSTCYSFSNFFFEDSGNQKTIAVINRVLNGQLCEPYSGQIAEATFNIKIDNRSPYVFRFWRGKNDLGEDNYYIVEVPVRG